MNTYIRRMTVSDSVMIKEFIDMVLFHKSMLKTYEPSELTTWSDTYTEQNIMDIAQKGHAYLTFDENKENLLASGCIDLSEDGTTAHIGMVFTHPDYRRHGLAKQIMEILEQDEYAKRVDRIELLSSMSAYRFYSNMGYVFLNDEYEITKERDSYGVPMKKILKTSEFANLKGKKPDE